MDIENGQVLLKKWLEDTGRKVNWAAGQIPVNRSHFHMWLNGTHTPQALYRQRIQDLTEGAVPVESWEQEASQAGEDRRGDAA